MDPTQRGKAESAESQGPPSPSFRFQHFKVREEEVEESSTSGAGRERKKVFFLKTGKSFKKLPVLIQYYMVRWMFNVCMCFLVSYFLLTGPPVEREERSALSERVSHGWVSLVTFLLCHLLDNVFPCIKVQRSADDFFDNDLVKTNL